MIRETKMTFKATSATTCDIYYETRDDNGAWEKQGVSPRLGTLEQVRQDSYRNQIHWGWTPYDPEDANTLTFWKEF